MQTFKCAQIRTHRRNLLAVFALLTICLVAVQPLPLPASSVKPNAKIKTTTKLKPSATTVKEGSKFTLTATISPSKATGTVAFYGSPAKGRPYIKLVTHPVVGGISKAPALPITGINGHVTFKAVYEGTTVYNTSTSNIVPVDITK